METETPDKKSIVFLRKRENNDLSESEYYELYNQSFQLVGKIGDFPDKGTGTELIEIKNTAQGDSAFGQAPITHCYFEPSLKSTLGRLDSNELIVCKSSFANGANHPTGIFNLSDSGKTSAESAFDGSDDPESLRECGYLLKGLSSLIAAFLFVSLGGWWWVPTIAAACYSLNCFRET